jgi:hypothetical protein
MEENNWFLLLDLAKSIETARSFITEKCSASSVRKVFFLVAGPALRRIREKQEKAAAKRVEDEICSGFNHRKRLQRGEKDTNNETGYSPANWNWADKRNGEKKGANNGKKENKLIKLSFGSERYGN